jgi:hypothetical protein
VWRTKKLSLNVRPMSKEVRAVVTELSMYDVILGRPRLARWNLRIDWRSDKLLVYVNGKSHVVDALSRMYDSTSRKLYYGEVERHRVRLLQSMRMLSCCLSMC